VKIFRRKERKIYMRKNYVTLLVMMLMLVGCATVQTNYIDPTGRALPNPSYTMKPIGTNMTVTFYYAGMKTSKDVDGSDVATIEYFDMFEKHRFFDNHYQGIALIIHINNPEELEYSLYEKFNANIGISYSYVEMQKGGEVNRSNLPYRQFVYNLPFREDVVDVDHTVTLMIKGDPMVQMGPFHYHIVH